MEKDREGAGGTGIRVGSLESGVGSCRYTFPDSQFFSSEIQLLSFQRNSAFLIRHQQQSLFPTDRKVFGVVSP